jgi:hypothetical protein
MSISGGETRIPGWTIEAQFKRESPFFQERGDRRSESR